MLYSAESALIQGRLAYASAVHGSDLYIHGGFNVPPPATGDAPLISENNLLNDIIKCGKPRFHSILTATTYIVNIVSYLQVLSEKEPCSVIWIPSGDPKSYPLARAYHNVHILFDSDGKPSELIIFGGMPYQAYISPLACGLNDIWAFDLNCSKWRQIKQNDAQCPPPSLATPHGGGKTTPPEDTSSPTSSTTLWIMFSLGLGGVTIVVAIYVWREWQKCRKFSPRPPLV